MSIIDLHVHSTKSDGTLTPTELVDYAMEKGLRAFALTDHDTVDGLDEAIAYAGQLRQTNAGNQNGSRHAVPEVVPGIEFSTEYHHRDIHIIGLYIDYRDPVFREKLHDFIDSRTRRNIKMCERLQEAGFDITYEELLETFPGSVITRAHFAQFMLRKGYITDLKEAFDQYIGDKCPCYVSREKVTPAKAVELILQADGFPVLAHPVLYRMPDAKLEILVDKLKKYNGLMGLEAIYSTYSPNDESRMRRLAQKYHLLISGGSDFHGANKPELDLSTGYGHLMVPGGILNDIKKSLKNYLFCDLDGTLLRSDCTISPKMKKALDRMAESEHILILSSGRPLPSILEICEQEDISYPDMIIVSNNGALIYDCYTNRSMQEYRLSKEDISYITAKAQEAGIHIHGYTKSQIVCKEMNEELRYYTKRIHMPIKYVKDISAALPEGSYKLQAIHLTDHNALVSFRESLLEYCGNRIQMIFSNEKYLEILPAAADKGQAVKFLTYNLPIPHSHTYAAGDAENDISMLKAAHMGIAMQNAPDSVKEAANVVTAQSNDGDGLLEILDKYFT